MRDTQRRTDSGDPSDDERLREKNHGRSLPRLARLASCARAQAPPASSRTLKRKRTSEEEGSNQNKQNQSSTKSRGESQTGGGSPGGPFLILNAASAVSTKQTAPPAEGGPIIRRFASSLVSLKVGAATNRSNRVLQWVGGNKVGKRRGFGTPTCKGRAGGPADGLRQERCCSGAGKGEKNREGEKQVRKPTSSC